MTYCTVPELQDHLQVEGEVVSLGLAIDAAGEAIDLHCERTFTVPTAATAKVYGACDPWRLKVEDIANTTDLVIATDQGNDGTFETTWTATDYELLPLSRRSGFPYTEIHAVGRSFPTAGTRFGRVQVTARHGWPATPDAVKEACQLLAAKVWRRRFSPDGTAGVNEFGVVRVTRNDPDVMALLNGFRRYAVLVG